MKTKDLIKKLQQIDPRGDMHVVVDNMDISSIHSEPAYYDGVADQIIKDQDDNIIGMKIKAYGDKIRIRIETLEDLLWDDPDLPVDCSELDCFVNPEHKKSYEKWVEEIRTKVKKENEKHDEWFRGNLQKAYTKYQTSKDLNEFDKDVGHLIRRDDEKTIEFFKSRSWCDTILDDWIEENRPERQ